MQFERCPTLLWRHAAGQLVLLNAGGHEAEPTAMTDLGALTWLALDRPSTIEELRPVLVDAVGPGDGPADADLRLAVDELVERGFIRPVP